MMQNINQSLAKGFGFNDAVIALFTVAMIAAAGALSLAQFGAAFI